MKKIKTIAFMGIFLVACEVQTLDEKQDSSSLELSGTEIWEQVAVRDFVTNELVPITGDNKVTLQINGKELSFGVNGKFCPGTIINLAIDLDSCFYQSPHWIISERSEDTIYMFPRVGAMHQDDLVLIKK